MTGIRSFFVLPAGLVVHAMAASSAAAVPAELSARPVVRIADQSRPHTDRDILLRMRAEDLARAASERFSEILSDDKQKHIAQTAAPKGGNGSKSADLDDETLRPVWDWLGRASETYEDVIIAKFRNPSGAVAIMAPPDAAEPTPPAGFSAPSGAAPELSPELSWGYIVENIREWLARANRSYRNEVVKKLVRPLEAEAPGEDIAAPAAETGARDEQIAEPAKVAEPEKAAETAEAPKIAVPAKTAEADSGAVPPPERKSAMAKVAPDAESVAAEAQRKAKAEAEAKRKAAEAEAKRLADEAEAERKAVAEAERLKKEEDAKREAAAEAERLAEKAEAERKAAGKAERLAAEEEARRKAAEVEAKRKAAAEAEAKRKAAAEAEAKRRAEEAEAKRKAAEAETEQQRLARAEVDDTAAGAVVPPERKEPAPEEAPEEVGEGADTGRSTEAPAAAAPVAPKPREERIVAEPERAAVEKKRHRVSKSRYRKKRVRRYRSRRYAAHARRYRDEARVYRYRYRKEVRRKRSLYRKRHWRKRHRICGKTRRYRHRRSHRSGGVYVVRRGDTLTKIARRYYGNGRAYRAIYRANRRRIRNPNRIYPRQRLYIP